VTKYLERFSIYPVTSEQITMLTGGNICHDASWSQDLNIPLTPLHEGIKKAFGQKNQRLR